MYVCVCVCVVFFFLFDHITDNVHISKLYKIV